MATCILFAFIIILIPFRNIPTMIYFVCSLGRNCTQIADNLDNGVQSQFVLSSITDWKTVGFLARIIRKRRYVCFHLLVYVHTV